jgi:hypothetical protein
VPVFAADVFERDVPVDFDVVDRFAGDDERDAVGRAEPLRLVELDAPDLPVVADRDPVPPERAAVVDAREPVVRADVPDAREAVERPAVPARPLVPERAEPDFAAVDPRAAVFFVDADRAVVPVERDFAALERFDVVRDPLDVVVFFLLESVVVVRFLGNFYPLLALALDAAVFDMAVESPVVPARNCPCYATCHSSLRMSGTLLPILSMPSTSTSGPPIMKSVCTAE